MQPDDVGVGSMVGGFKVMVELILRNETVAKGVMMPEIENGVALDVAHGDLARNTL